MRARTQQTARDLDSLGKHFLRALEEKKWFASNTMTSVFQNTFVIGAHYSEHQRFSDRAVSAFLTTPKIVEKC